MADQQPNVLFVLTDQWRASALGCAGNDDVRTPVLDGLAGDGVRFADAITTKPMCTPARASIVTSTFPHESRVLYNQLRLPTDLVSVAEPLCDAGYDTGYVGKWHLDGPNSLFVPPGPRRQGFDNWYGFNTTSHDYDAGHPEFDESGAVTWREGYQPAVQTDIATEFIESHAGEDPFFLFLSWGPPHPPKSGWNEGNAPEEYSSRYDPDALTLRPNVPDDGVFVRPDRPRWDAESARRHLVEYYGYVTSLDDCLGRLLDTLDAMGIAEETIVVFTSDHGEMIGSQGRVNKGTPFEEAINVPLIVRYPGRVDGNRVSEAVVSLNDLMPTLLSLCEAPIPASQVQGTDLSRHLLGETPGPDRAYVEGWRVENDVPGAEDWGPWGQPWRLVRTREHSLTIDHTLETQYLYDLDADPYQLDNLAGDPAATALEADLREELFDLASVHDDREFVTRRRYM